MNKAIAAAVAVVVIGGGIWYFVSQKDKPTDQQDSTQNESNSNTNNTNANTDTDTSAKTNASLKDLALSNKAQKCTFSTVRDSSEVTGTTYLNGQGKYRVDFTSKDNNQISAGHNIFDSNSTVYFWIEGQAQGFKYDVVSYETLSEGAVDPNAKTEYDCTSWNVDNSMFTPPSNVQFVSFAELMNEQR